MTVAKKAAPRKKVARPGDPGYDWSKDYEGEEVFTYTLPDGRTVGLAAIGDQRRFTIGEIRRATRMNEVQQVMQVLEKISSPNALAIIDELEDDSDFRDMMDAWTEWMKTSVGESSAP